jgi:hypothetical protein
MVRTRALLLAIGALAAACCGAGTAPKGEPVSNDATFNYGLSSFLGSGIYTIGGQSVQLYRIPITVALTEDKAARTRYFAQLPITFGFYGFTPTDVLNGSVPSSLDTVSVLGGIEARHTIDERWRYIQLLAVGYTVAAGHSDRKLVGSQSALERTAPLDRWRTRWRNEVLAAVSAGGPQSSDKVIRLLEGVEFDRPQSWTVFGRQAAIGTYGVLRWYGGGAAPFATGGDADRLEAEVGVTFGTAEPIRILDLPLPRLSLGYRRAAALNIFFLGFGTPF